MEKLHIRKIASLGLMLCFFTGGGAQTPVKVEKRKEHKSNTVIPVVKGNVTDTLSLVSFNDFHGAFACDKGVPGSISPSASAITCIVEAVPMKEHAPQLGHALCL